MVDILAITAHPDDIECGGLGIMLLAKKAGKKIGLIISTKGEGNGNPTVRAKEAMKAQELCGFDYFEHLDFPDSGLQNVLPDLVETLVPLVVKQRPTTLLTLHPDDYHPDHITVSKATDSIYFLSRINRYSKGKPYAPKDEFYFSLDRKTNRRTPDILVNIDNVMPIKMKACSIHESQKVNSFVKGLASSLGVLADCEYAEGLYLKRPFVLTNIPSIFTGGQK